MGTLIFFIICGIVIISPIFIGLTREMNNPKMTGQWFMAYFLLCIISTSLIAIVSFRAYQFNSGLEKLECPQYEQVQEHFYRLK